MSDPYEDLKDFFKTKTPETYTSRNFPDSNVATQQERIGWNTSGSSTFSQSKWGYDTKPTNSNWFFQEASISLKKI